MFILLIIRYDKFIFSIFKNLIVNLGWFFIPFAIFVIVGSSNAVNLTDGLDGLPLCQLY